jgi:predicted O-methyltransferase YrrM
MDDPAWALTPAALARVLAEVDAGRDSIVECGSGASTVAIARALAERGDGRLYCLEHDPRWAARVRAQLGAQGVEERVEVLDAPVRPRAPAGVWYDERALAALPGRIDLLLVDGPPADLAPDGEIRYPALPALASRLEEGALVILDDIHRPGERRIVDRWRRELGVSFELHGRERIAIGVFCEHQDRAQARTSERRT